MKTRTLTQKAATIVASIFILLASAGAAKADYKIKQRITIQGQTMELTVYVKGSRQRTEGGGFMGMGAEVVTIEQCDMKRTIQVNDNKKLYFIIPFATPADETTGGGAANVSNNKTVRGGVVTVIYNITDTGERKQMFGLTARHIKTVMTMQSSPDACSKNDMRIETDGWYVDLPQFSCPIQVPRNLIGMSERGDCQDRFVFKQSGSGRLGFPLMEKRTMSEMSGNMSFTITTETLELSTATLDASLFDIPKNYKPAKSSQDLYETSDMGAVMRNMGGNTEREDNPSTTTQNNSMSVGVKPAGVIRIGVLALSNSSGRSVSTESLRETLITSLTSGNIEAIAVSSNDDAKSKSCDYVLSVDISKLKQSTANKISGLFGKVTGVETSATKDKFEVQIDYKLATPDGQIKAQNKFTQKIEGSAESAAQTALAQAANEIIGATGKK